MLRTGVYTKRYAQLEYFNNMQINKENRIL